MKPSTTKSWIKYILLFSGAVVLLSVILLAAAIVVLDDEDYRRLAVWSVENLAGYRMIVEGPFLLDLSTEPSLTVEKILFEALAEGPSPPITSIGHLQIKIALKPLLWGNAVIKQLRIEDVSIDQMNFQEDKDSDSWLDNLIPEFLIPVFESVIIKNIKLRVKDRTTNRDMQIHLNRFAIEDVQDRGPLYVNGDGFVNETAFNIEGQMGALADIFSRKKPYPIDINLTIVDLSLKISGKFADYADGEGMNLQIVAEERELAELLKSLNIETPPLGRLEFKAMLSGDLNAPRLSDLYLLISDDSSLELTAKGSIDNIASGEGTDISLSGVCTNETVLKRIFPDDLQIVEKFKFNGALHHEKESFWIEDFEAHMVNDIGVTAEAEGRLHLGDLNDSYPVKEVDLNLHLVSNRTSAIRPLLTDALPEIGSVDAKGRLVGPVDRLALEDLVIIRGGSGPVRVEGRGRLGWIPLPEDEPISEIDLSFSGRAEQSKILSTFYEVPIDEIGTVTITGRVTGATNRFQLKEIEFHSKDAQGLETKMSGDINFVEQTDGKILGDVNFKVQIVAPNMGAGAPLLGANLVPGLGPVRAEFLVQGTTDVLAIESIEVTAGKAEKVQIKWRGRVGRAPLGGTLPISEVQTFGSLQAAKSSDFAALFGITIPDIGPVKSSWQEVDRNGIIGVENVKFTAGDGKTFQLVSTGRVESVIRYDEAFIDGFDIQLAVRGTNTDNLFKLLGIQFPNLGAIDGRVTLSGGIDKLPAEGLHLTVKSSQGLDIVAKGRVGYIGLEKTVPIREIDVQITALAPEVGALPRLDNLGLPDLGAIQASASILDRSGELNIDTFNLRVGSEDLAALQMHGQVKHLLSRDQMNLAADFEVYSKPWLESYLQRTVPENPKFNGSVKLTNAADHIRIEAFEMKSPELGGMSIHANGKANVASESPEIDFDIDSVIKDPAAWGTLFDLSLPHLASLTVDGQYSNKRKMHSFNGEMRLGDTEFQTVVSSSSDHSRSSTDIKISSNVIYLQDFGLHPEKLETKTVSPAKSGSSTSGPIFNEQPLPFDKLKSNDITLNFRADEVRGKEAALKSVALKAELKNGRFRLDPFEVKYRHGHLSLESDIDTSGSEPTASLKISAEDVDIDDMLSYMHEPLILHGQLTLAIDLQSQGRSSKDLASNLSGQFGFAIEKGKIKRGVEMIASDALDLLFTASKRKTYTKLNCMASQLEFQKGIGTLKILYLDTPGVRAQGGGSVNLGSESVDIFIKPESKRRLFKRSSAVKVKGQLNNPSASKVPANEAVILGTQVIVPFIAIPGRAVYHLFSLVRDDKDEKSPCFQGMFRKN